MFKRLFERREKSSMFHQKKENELLNILVSFLVASSLVVFPFARLGLIAVFAWGLFLIIAYIRQYSYLTMSIIAFVFLAISIYQVQVTVEYIQDQRLYGDLVVVTPEERPEYGDPMTIDVEITNDNVKSIDYQFSTSKKTNPSRWSIMDETGEIAFNNYPKGSYYLVLRIFFEEGDSFMTYEYYGRYAIGD